MSRLPSLRQLKLTSAYCIGPARAYLAYFTQSWRSLPSMFVFGTIEDTPNIIRTGCKTIIRPLRHIIGIFFFLTKSPCGGPRGSGLDQNCTCTTRPWDQQQETINRSLRYLVTEEIEEQDIVYGQTDGQTAGRRTKGYRISSTGLWPVELIKWKIKIKIFFRSTYPNFFQQVTRNRHIFYFGLTSSHHINYNYSSFSLFLYYFVTLVKAHNRLSKQVTIKSTICFPLKAFWRWTLKRCLFKC